MVLEVPSQGKSRSNTHLAPNSSRDRDISIRCSLDTCSMPRRTLMQFNSTNSRCPTQPNIRKCLDSKEPRHRATLSLGELMNRPPIPNLRWISKENSFCPICKEVLQTMSLAPLLKLKDYSSRITRTFPIRYSTNKWVHRSTKPSIRVKAIRSRLVGLPCMAISMVEVV